MRASCAAGGGGARAPATARRPDAGQQKTDHRPSGDTLPDTFSRAYCAHRHAPSPPATEIHRPQHTSNSSAIERGRSKVLRRIGFHRCSMSSSVTAGRHRGSRLVESSPLTADFRRLPRAPRLLNFLRGWEEDGRAIRTFRSGRDDVAGLAGRLWHLPLDAERRTQNPPDGSVSSACADLFDQSTLATYSVDIAAADWSAMEAEFKNLTALESGAEFAVYHPIVFHLGERDGERRRHQAARRVVLVPDGHARRRPRQDAVRRLVRQDQPERQVPRRHEAGVRHAALRLDVPARSRLRTLAAPGRDPGPLLGQRTTGDQWGVLRPLLGRARGGKCGGRAVLPFERQGRSLEGGHAGRDQPEVPRLRASHDLSDGAGSGLARGHRRHSRVGDLLGGRGAAQRRRRLLRRLAQLLPLRSGGGRLRLPAQRHRLDLRLAARTSIWWVRPTIPSIFGTRAPNRPRCQATSG